MPRRHRRIFFSATRTGSAKPCAQHGTVWSGVHPRSEAQKLRTLFVQRKGALMSRKNRKFSPEFRIAAAQRMLAGGSVTKVQCELGVKRSVLYRWRERSRTTARAGGGTGAQGRPAGDVPGFFQTSLRAGQGGVEPAARRRWREGISREIRTMMPALGAGLSISGRARSQGSRSAAHR